MENNQLRRILLIDDDDFIIRLLSLVLTKAKYEIISASNGKNAISILSEQPVDMIILDLRMPEMDGLAFLKWVRKEANLTVPILILTAMVSADTEKQAMAEGASALLYKPIKVPDLLEKMQQLEHTFNR
ncbi:MAG: response regulator [Nitrospira sp.]